MGSAGTIIGCTSGVGRAASTAKLTAIPVGKKSCVEEYLRVETSVRWAQRNEGQNKISCGCATESVSVKCGEEPPQPKMRYL